MNLVDQSELLAVPGVERVVRLLGTEARSYDRSGAVPLPASARALGHGLTQLARHVERPFRLVVHCNGALVLFQSLPSGEIVGLQAARNVEVPRLLMELDVLLGHGDRPSLAPEERATERPPPNYEEVTGTAPSRDSASGVRPAPLLPDAAVLGALRTDGNEALVDPTVETPGSALTRAEALAGLQRVAAMATRFFGKRIVLNYFRAAKPAPLTEYAVSDELTFTGPQGGLSSRELAALRSWVAAIIKRASAIVPEFDGEAHTALGAAATLHQRGGTTS